MINIAVSGACGRMGLMVLKEVSIQDDMRIAGAVEREGHPRVGMSIEEAAGVEACGAEICSRIEDIKCSWDVLIDFSSPEGTMANLRYAVKTGRGAVIGTTGLDGGQVFEIKRCAEKIPVLFSPNMSIGVNLLFELVKEAAGALGDYDVEIIEMHHRLKKDSPSGTARRLAEIVAEASVEGRGDVVHGRRGLEGRQAGEVGMHSVRGGTVTGEHAVVFFGAGERLELTHRAEGREIFSGGAVRAARFIARSGPGFYSMRDVVR